MAKNIFLAILLIAPTIFSAETKGGMPQLNPESFSSQIFWLVTLFAILFIFIHFFFFPKLIKIRQEREKTVENYLQKANEINDSVNKIVESGVPRECADAAAWAPKESSSLSLAINS